MSSAALPPDHAGRLERAHVSLEGLSVGDGFGGFFELRTAETMEHHVRQRRLPPSPWHYTDDTNMALSIYEILRRHGQIDQDALAASFAKHFERTRGYGMGARTLLTRMLGGQDWRVIAPEIFKGGSFGNGGGMRVAPLGAYFADKPADFIAEQARLSSEITHAHPEGIAGTAAVALAAAQAWKMRQANIRPSRSEFIDEVLKGVLSGAVYDGLVKARDLPAGTTVREVIRVIGNGSRVTAQDSVPFAVWCSGEWLDDYEAAIWNTASGGGDVDTTCAMVGGIVATYTGLDAIPQSWRESRESLPTWAFED